MIQPNYTYESTALSAFDPLSVQQWALSNDSSLYIEKIILKERFQNKNQEFG